MAKVAFDDRLREGKMGEGIIARWLILDGIGSIIMYWKKPGYNGKEQSWKTDYWLRAVRAAMGVALIFRRKG